MFQAEFCAPGYSAPVYNVQELPTKGERVEMSASLLVSRIEIEMGIGIGMGMGMGREIGITLQAREKTTGSAQHGGWK
jgi:hypothetical protein